MRFKAIVAYDGTAYHGFQSQKNAIGIQYVIEKSLRLMTQTEIKIHASGRTDKGVHAINQVFHFDSDLDIDWLRVNDRLPLDIRIKKVVKVSEDFHARHHAKSKKYKYVLSKKESTVFRKNYEVYVRNLKIEPMIEASKDFEGIHDFKGFCKHVKGKPTIKTIYEVKFKETKQHYIFTFHGNSFLKYMVRSMMGTLIEIGLGKKDPMIIKTILETQNRKLAGKTAESRGLYLERVYYK